MTIRIPRNRLLAAATLGLLTAALAGAQEAPKDAPAAASPTSAPSIDAKAKQVFDRFVEATGGKAAYEKIKTREYKGTITIAAQGISGTISSRTESPDKLSLVTDIAGIGAIEQGLVGNVAWMRNPMQGTSLIEGKQLEQLKTQTASETSALTPEKMFTSVQYAGEETVDGKPADKLVCDGAAGKSTQYFDKASGLLVKSEEVNAGPQGDVPVTSAISDYREVDGIKMAFSRTVTIGGATEMKLVITEVKINPTLPPDTFKIPDEVQKLLNDKKK